MYRILIIVASILLLAVIVWATPPAGTTESPLATVTGDTILYGHDGTTALPDGYGYLTAQEVADLAVGDDLGAATYADIVDLWTTCTGYLRSDGTCDTPAGDDLGSAVATDVTALFSGSGDYLKSDGTLGTPAGDDLGSATYADIVDLWTTCTGFLKSDGTCEVPGGDDLGSATSTDVAALFSGSGDYLKSDGTRGTPAGGGGDVTLSSITDWPVTVDATEVSYLDGVTSAIQTQLNTIDSTIGAYGDAVGYSVGTDPGQIPVLGDDGSGGGALGIISIDLPTGASYLVDGTAMDISDLTDTGNLLAGAAGDDLGSATALDVIDLWSGSGDYLKSDGTLGTPSGGGGGIELPAGCVEDDILVVDSTGTDLVCMPMEAHPQFIVLLDALHSLGGNTITVTAINPNEYPYYTDSPNVSLEIGVATSNPSCSWATITFTVAGTAYSAVPATVNGAITLDFDLTAAGSGIYAVTTTVTDICANSRDVTWSVVYDPFGPDLMLGADDEGGIM
jgi:hypothetical protein